MPSVNTPHLGLEKPDASSVAGEVWEKRRAGKRGYASNLEVHTVAFRLAPTTTEEHRNSDLQSRKDTLLVVQVEHDHALSRGRSFSMRLDLVATVSFWLGSSH